jgi:hypothetical protein
LGEPTTKGTKSVMKRTKTHLIEDTPDFTPNYEQKVWQKFTDTVQGVVNVNKADIDKALAKEQDKRRKGRGNNG